MAKLESCPFCGGEAEEKTYQTESGLFVQGKQYIYYQCKSCRARTKEFGASVNYSAIEKAAEAWNRRVKC